VSRPHAAELAAWVCRVSFADIPADVVLATKRRLLDVIGLACAGSDTAFGRSTRAGAMAISPPGPCRVLGTGERMGIATAAMVNAALPQALEFDDTHNESIVHMSSPSVAAALALAEAGAAGAGTAARGPAGPPRPTSAPIGGRDLLTAVALANEISCRVGSVSPGQFHKRGLHPTGLFAPFGVTYGAGKLLGLSSEVLASAAGICGSFAAGLLECWVDGTQTKFLHSGWAAHSGLSAALLARSGMTGPARVFEGRFGLFASHLQDESVARDFDRLTGDLGTRWESRNASFKPYPAAHVIHPYLDAILRLCREHGVGAADVERIECPVAGFIVGIVCEPVHEKIAPATDAHCRVSLQHTLAEAVCFGDLGRTAYEESRRLNPEVQALARRVGYYVDPDYPGPGRFKGAVHVTLKDGRRISEVQEYNLGSPQNPMTDAQLRAKFDDNARDLLSAAQRDRLADAIAHAERLADASDLVTLTLPYA
jgi:2-methylcitrate dehydratase PrpD